MGAPLCSRFPLRNASNPISFVWGGPHPDFMDALMQDQHGIRRVVQQMPQLARWLPAKTSKRLRSSSRTASATMYEKLFTPHIFW